MGEVAVAPASIPLITHGLHPGYFRYRRNWRATRKIWTSLVAEAYARPMPDDAEVAATGIPFWACLRRAFPDAMRDKREYELCVANFMLVYGAGLETTASSIGMILALLALDKASMAQFESVRLAMTRLGKLAHSLRTMPRGDVAHLLPLTPTSRYGHIMILGCPSPLSLPG